MQAEKSPVAMTASSFSCSISFCARILRSAISCDEKGIPELLLSAANSCDPAPRWPV